MTGIEFREIHGDPADWSDADYEDYFAITTRDAHPDQHELAA